MHSRAAPTEGSGGRGPLAVAVILAAVLVCPAALLALGSSFTYQGRLEQDGTPVNGGCDFAFSLFDGESGGNQVGATIPATSQRLTDGLFNVEVDFGPGVFDGADRWLEIRVRCPQGSASSYAVLGPRQHLTATPYALFAPSAGDLTCVGCVDSTDLASGAVTSAQIAGGAIQQSHLAFTPGTITSITAGNGLSGGTITTSGTIAANIGTGPGTVAAGDHSHASSYWALTGNAGTNGATSFLGTTDGQPFEVRVNGARALRIEPDSTSPRLIGGHSANAASPGAYGATIAGGGTTANGNEVTDIYGSVGGGSNNRAGNGAGAVNDARHAVVGGGANNTAGGTGATVCGGQANAAGGENATIAGGQGNYASASGAAVGGGSQNDASAESATIGGGASNVASGLSAAVGGGVSNRAEGEGATIAGGGSNVAATGAAIGGGGNNIAAGRSSVIGGGSNNGAARKNATVGGGAFNEVIGDYATIGGGTYNSIGAGYATIGGGGPSDGSFPGETNNRVYDEFGTIGGGGGNRAGSDDADTRSSTFTTVGGGESNYADGAHATVGGGKYNDASGGQATIAGGYKNVAGVNASVGGGSSNVAAGIAATISGGAQNSADGYLATVGGGYANVAGGSFATIAGGGPSNPLDFDTKNEVSDDYGTIGGGGGNRAGSDDADTTNATYATVGGGNDNAAINLGATVGGGGGNRAEGWFATVPGGVENLAAGDYSFAAGTQAKAYNRGCVVITDSHASDEPCTNDNRFVFRVTNAFYIWTDVNHVTGIVLPTGGTGWAPLSDRNAKENFQPVDGRDVLSRLAAVPIQTWNLKTQPGEIRHIGPVAQDFAAAFGFGEDDTHINTVDADGVAFAAIQGLYELLQAKDARIDALEARLDALEARDR